eukprot:7997003-Pyramimonas_sp.AAC.2
MAGHSARGGFDQSSGPLVVKYEHRAYVASKLLSRAKMHSIQHVADDDDDAAPAPGRDHGPGDDPCDVNFMRFVEVVGYMGRRNKR